MRGAFTAGVLDVFMENELYFPYVVGVSSGALIAISYLSRQIGRSRSVFIDYMSDRNFVSKKFLLTKRSLFNFDYLFGELAQSKLPFDRDVFALSPIRFVVATTSCLDGMAKYFVKGETEEFFHAVAASSSLPFMSMPVMVEGTPCLDGGMAVPIPYQKALDDGFKKMVVITTRDKNYRKDESKRQFKTALKALYAKYPNFVSTALKYPHSYNQCAEELERLEERGIALVIRPREPIMLRRTEKDKVELQNVYLRGRIAGLEMLPRVIEYIKK